MVDTEQRQLEREVDRRRLERLCLIHDDFMSEALNGKKEAVGFILRTILERNDLTVAWTATQVESKSALHRSIRMDVKAVDTEGRVMNIEIQRADSGAGEKRARYHSGALDHTLLRKGEDFQALPETFVIFITENDKFHAGLPLYHINRKIEELDNKPFEDEAHIIYVNGSFREETHPIGRLMHDFFCPKASEMFSPELANEVRYLKETEGGQGQMYDVLEDMRNEVAKRTAHEKAIEFARNLLSSKKLTNEEISQFSGLSLEEVEKLSQKQTA